MLRVCKKCNWVAFSVTRDHAQQETEKFNTYFRSLTKKHQQDYYGGKESNIKFYMQCFACGNPHTNFRRALKADIKRAGGHTIQPIMYEPRKRT